MNSHTVQLVVYYGVFSCVSVFMLYTSFAWTSLLHSKKTKKQYMKAVVIMLCVSILCVPWALYLAWVFSPRLFENPEEGGLIYRLLLGSSPGFIWILLQMFVNGFIIVLGLRYLRKDKLDEEEFKAILILSACMRLLVAFVLFAVLARDAWYERDYKK